MEYIHQMQPSFGSEEACYNYMNTGGWVKQKIKYLLINILYYKYKTMFYISKYLNIISQMIYNHYHI